MAWMYLLLAGIFEVVWAVCMKYSHGFTVLPYTAATVAGMAVSVWFLTQAVKGLPLGTAYVIWTGIGGMGAFLAGVFLFKEPVTALRCLFALLLLAGIIGLKVTTPGE